ncbi:uncharacterized protein [Dysidea avara]|uniref:uncharacterized protein n=1 Tax=Dysidea avara TaxID=196820 RepID=UPI0033167321
MRQPLYDGKYFETQSNVDQFVNQYPVKPAQHAVEECNEFLAGNVLRTKFRYSALDETGVIGIACRHEHPYSFYSLRHGERISYIVYALEKLKEQCSNQSAVYLLYDVACILKRHLQSQQRNDLTEFFKLVVPVFHAYGHKVDCQFSMSAAYQAGFGLTDGEVLERCIWAVYGFSHCKSYTMRNY